MRRELDRYLDGDDPAKALAEALRGRSVSLVLASREAKVDRAIADRFGEPYVSLKFNAQGAQDFDRITAENVKKRLAIVLDGVIHSAPVIQERISGGNAQKVVLARCLSGQPRLLVMEERAERPEGV